MTTKEAAEILGVSQTQARRRAQHGELIIVGKIGQTLLLDAVSVRRAAQITAKQGRIWSTKTAWAAITLLDGGTVKDLTATHLWKLRRKMINSTADDLVRLTRNRALTQTFRASRSYLTVIQEALIASGSADAGRTDGNFNLSVNTDRAEGYTDSEGLDEIIRSYGLISDAEGNVVIHITEFTEQLSRGSSLTLTALDLANSIHVREQSAGRRTLTRLLKRTQT